MRVQSFGLDWLTVTDVLDDSIKYPPLADAFTRLSDVPLRWTGQGYRGLQDEYKGLRYGSRLRADGRVDEILIMSGVLCDEMLGEIKNITDYRATRLDIQLTVLLDVADQELSSRAYEQLSQQRKFGTSPSKRRKLSNVRSETGQTLYIGRRKTGRKFFRLYDKSDDLGLALGKAWRQEVQYGRDMAEAALKQYLTIKGNRRAIIDLVCAEFIDAVGFALSPDVGSLPDVSLKTPEKEKTLERKLKWLKECVRPTIALLIEHDLERAALECLGLSGAWPHRWDEGADSFSQDRDKG